MQHYNVGKCIGRGNYGAAYLAKDTRSHELVVLKKIALTEMSPEECESAHQEVQLLSSLHHPNVVEYRDSFTEAGNLYIAMQYCEAGDLSKQVKRRAKTLEYFSEEQILDWFLQVLEAIMFLHNQKILHRDLKTSNVFLMANNLVKLGDFGIARVLDHSMEQANTVIGTPYYMSPEVCENKPYSYKSDYWALGCILYELCTLKHAFDASNLLSLVYKIVQEQAPPIPSHYSEDLQRLVHGLLQKSPDQRLDGSAISVLPFIQARKRVLHDSGGTIGKAVPLHKTERQRREDRKRLQREREAEDLFVARQEAAHQRQLAKLRKEQQFRPSQNAHILGLSSGDKQCQETNRSQQAKLSIQTGASPANEASGRLSVRSWSSVQQQPSEHQSPPAEQPSLWPEFVDNREIRSSGAYRWEEALQRESEGATVAAEHSAEHSDSDYYSDDFESDDSEVAGAYDTARKERDARDADAFKELMGNRSPACFNATNLEEVSCVQPTGILQVLASADDMRQQRAKFQQLLSADGFAQVVSLASRCCAAGATPTDDQYLEIVRGFEELLPVCRQVEQFLFVEQLASSPRSSSVLADRK